MSPKGKAYGVRLSEEAVKEFRWQVLIRAWTFRDLGEEAKVDPHTITRYVGGASIHPAAAGRLQQALVDNPPIKGLADLLKNEAAS